MGSEYSSLEGFGDLLKSFRKRKKFTQKTLAKRLGVHYNTIGVWERGEYLPESKTIVVELAHQLNLNEQEARLLLDASLTTSSPHWSVPHHRNLIFTGREVFLDTLDHLLRDTKETDQSFSVALVGLGGIGKTQTALEYVYRHALDYSALFWVRAETKESLITSFLRIAEHLMLPEYQDQDQHRMLSAVHRWLGSRYNWLIVWDNLEDQALLQTFFPNSHQGKHIFTTRRPTLGSRAVTLELPLMTQEEGIAFLLRSTNISTLSASETSAVEEIIAIMGMLPLAIEHVGAYVQERQCSFADYLQHFIKQRSLLIDRCGSPRDGYAHSVMTTFHLLGQHIRAEHPQAFHMLSMCAFLYSEDIPEEIFIGDGSDQALFEDQYQLDQAIATLRNYSLIKRSPETHTLSIHRLVQTVIREKMSPSEFQQWQQTTAQRLNALFPIVNYARWSLCERFLPHALNGELAACDTSAAKEMAPLLRRAGDYLRERENLDRARSIYSRALQALAHLQEPSEALQIDILQGLALTEYRRKNHQEAWTFCTKALQLSESTPHLDMSQRARLLNNTGTIADELGKWEQAEQCFQQAIALLKPLPATEFLSIAWPLANLAEILIRQGDLRQAEQFYWEAFRIWQETLGSEHPQLGHPLCGLAEIFRQEQRYEEAETYALWALYLRENALSPECREVPEVLFTRNLIARLHQEKQQRALSASQPRIVISHEPPLVSISTEM